MRPPNMARSAPMEQGAAARMPAIPQKVRGLLRRLPGGAWIGFAILGVVITVGIAAPLVAPHSPTQIDLASALRPPRGIGGANSSYLLGTDQLGRDVLSRIIYGARVSLMIAVSAVAMAALIGVALGVIAGYYGGRVDDVLMRLADIQLAFPAVILAIIVAATLGGGMRNLVIVLGVIGWTTFARVARGSTLSERKKQYVEAAMTVGCSDVRIMFRHILPNLASPLLVVAAFTVAQMVLWEAGLSFLGLGVPPPQASWGSMLADGRSQLATAWWMATLPGIAIAITILGINLVGEWLREHVAGMRNL